MRLQAETIARSSVNLRLGFCGQSRYSAVQGFGAGEAASGPKMLRGGSSM